MHQGWRLLQSEAKFESFHRSSELTMSGCSDSAMTY